MNYRSKYYNFRNIQRNRKILRFGILTLIILLSVGASVFVSNQVNYIHLKEIGQSSKLSSLAESRSSAVSTYSTTPVAGVSDSSAGSRSEAAFGYQDYRAYVLDEYFRYHQSPLYGTGDLFVEACDTYGAPKDCTTVAAIAHAETELCKYFNSADYHNCWGFGGAGVNRTNFPNWRRSITLVTDRLVNTYGIRYMINPSLMEDTFCGNESGCTNWGTRVKYFMAKISEFPRQRGYGPPLFSLR